MFGPGSDSDSGCIYPDYYYVDSPEEPVYESTDDGDDDEPPVRTSFTSQPFIAG
jgi:hypothetical protein